MPNYIFQTVRSLSAAPGDTKPSNQRFVSLPWADHSQS
jgi:hypothetical protein